MNCKDMAVLCPQYLSGDLDGEQAREFAEHLRGCAQCAGQVQQQTDLDSLLRHSVLSEAADTASLDQRVRLHIASHQRGLFFSRFALAATFALVLLGGGIVAYRSLFIPAVPRLCADAARDHFKEVTGGEHRRWLTDPKAIADLAASNGLPSSFVTSLEPAGYHLEHAKLCRLAGRVFLHLVFTQGANEFSTYLTRPPAQPLGSPGKHIYETNSGHEHIAYFQTSQLTAMFVTDQSADAALSIARSAAGTL